MTIGYNGTVFPCVSDYLARDPIGDVKIQSLYEIWHDKKINDLRMAHVSKKAFGCFASCGDCCHGGLMKEEELQLKNRTIKLRKYVGQDPNVQRLGGRVKPKDGKMWYEEIKVPEKGRRKLKKSVKSIKGKNEN